MNNSFKVDEMTLWSRIASMLSSLLILHTSNIVELFVILKKVSRWGHRFGIVIPS